MIYSSFSKDVYEYLAPENGNDHEVIKLVFVTTLQTQYLKFAILT